MHDLTALNLYIPFWLYSNYDSADSSRMNRNLYIPFWLYSNELANKGNGGAPNFTFHSGYILISDEWADAYGNSLYIPFWLYSNAHSSITYCITVALYIPFWLYSNIYLHQLFNNYNYL